MRCINPLEIGKNSFPCGKCNFCLQVKRADWTFRLTQETKVATDTAFLTLTYADGYDQEGKHIAPVSPDGELQLSKEDVQLFTKRLRKAAEPAKLRYYTVGEYGTETERPHYHSIMFGLPQSMLPGLNSIWKKGNVHVGKVEFASIHYVTKYVVERTGDYGGREPPFSLMSRRPGIGNNYLGTHSRWHLDGLRNYANINGTTSRLPRYFKDRIFNEKERAMLHAEGITLSRNDLVEEITRIRKFCDEPYSHYVERLHAEHDRLTNTISKFNHF